MIKTNNSSDTQMLEAEFYSSEIKLSYSSLNKLLTAPSVYYKEYILKQKEETIAKYLLEGTLIHYLVLDGLDFDSKFIIAPNSLPSDNSISVIKEVFEIYKSDNKGEDLQDYSSDILDILNEKKLHARIKDDDKRVAKIADIKGHDYFNFLKKQNGRTIIDAELLDKCSKRAEIIKADENTRNLIGLDLIHDGTKIGVYNEIELEAPYNDKFSLKGVLDNLVVDVVNQEIIINDFKTTSKSLDRFSESVDYYNYWLQAVIYIKLAQDFLSDVMLDQWTIKFNFIVFDRYDQLYSFGVSDNTLSEWNKKALEVFKAAEYHIDNKEFKLPYKYTQNSIML